MARSTVLRSLNNGTLSTTSTTTTSTTQDTGNVVQSVQSNATYSGLVANTVVVADAQGNLVSTTFGLANLSYFTPITSNLQATLNGLQITGGATTIKSANLTANRALTSDASGKVAASAVTATELGYVSGVTSGIQTQLNALQTATGASVTASRALVSDASGKVSASTVTSTELGYLSGVSSGIQTQLNNLAITGGASTIKTSDLTASRALVSDASGKVAVSVVTSTELGYVSGATSALQTQINNMLPLTGGTITGSLIVNGGITGTLVGSLPQSTFLYANNSSTSAGTAIAFQYLKGVNNASFAYGTLDANGTSVVFNTDGVYRISCVKSVSTATLSQQTWEIYTYASGAVFNAASPGTNVLSYTTPQFTAIAGAEIGVRAGQRMAIVNTGSTQTWYSGGSPSLWTIIPLSLGYPG